LADILAELDNILKNLVRNYGYKQNSVIKNDIKQKMSVFENELFRLRSFPRFQTPVQSFIFCPFKFRFDLEITNFQYRSYLQPIKYIFFA
jgi:hypothetical protein